MAFLFVADLLADFLFKRLDEVEGDVGWLEVFGLGVRNVVDERAECGCAGNRGGFFALRDLRGVEPSQHAGGDGLRVALDAGELTGYEDGRLEGVVPTGLD